MRRVTGPNPWAGLLLIGVALCIAGGWIGAATYTPDGGVAPPAWVLTTAGAALIGLSLGRMDP